MNLNLPIIRSPLFFRLSALILVCVPFVSIVQAQGVKTSDPNSKVPESDGEHAKERNEWFFRGRLVHGKASAELRRQANQAKIRMRAQHAAALSAMYGVSGAISLSSGSWIPLGPVPLASDASGNGTQDYHQVSGRATAVAIDPADPSGNTIYIGGAQSGVWKSTNAANNTANDVIWTPVSDDQATLSIGAIAIQPGNSDPAKTLILAATGEANNSADSYFGLGILRSADAGTTWSLISSANGGALSFSGLGGTRMAFNSANGKTNTVVSAMATTSEGLIEGVVTANTARGLYTSLDAGQSWTYNVLVDPDGTTDATSATSVAYNGSAGRFFAAVRYHGFYSSSDGTNWTRLPVQPGGTLLNAGSCPPLSTSNNYACPFYRAEITAVSGRNEMYAWFIYLSAEGETVDGKIWQSTNGGTSWNEIDDDGIANCGDVYGCGVQQGAYDLELLAVPNGAATDLYAGGVNLYKCEITAQNPVCSATPFMNLTHVYGCAPIAALAHVHPNQHALTYMIPNSGSDSGNALMYFANDGGIYRALNSVAGLNTGACSGVNQFDDLNQNLGSMTQFVSFSQHPTDKNVLLGGAQGNGSPASSQATTNPGWVNVLGGDGGSNAIDPAATSNWYATNPDVPPAGLGIQLCPNGVKCVNSAFNVEVTSSSLGGDDGAFYFPFILDPKPQFRMLVGTCRVWRGPKTGGLFSALSPNFDTLGTGTCSGSEVNLVRALAVGGPTDATGSKVIYATTCGRGPIDGALSSPTGGRVWVTTDASSGVPAFADVTDNGPQGNINPNQFPISSVAIDSSDATGKTAFVTVMGFTGGTGHVWKTTNAGVSWTDFTANLPDSPANAVVAYPGLSSVYVATDVGVFGSATSAANWTELGPDPKTGLPGFLPNVAVTALAVFNSGGQQLLRASTYGRGIWQFNLVITPDFQMTVSNSVQSIFLGQTTTFNGTITALNGYTSSVTLSCIAGSTSPPSTCTPSPKTLTPLNKTPFTVTAAGAAGDYYFNVKAVGTDSKTVTHQVPLALHVISFGMTNPTPTTVTVGRGSTSSPVNFQITAAGSFSQSVTVSCSTTIPGATCALTPSNTVYPTSSSPVNMTARVTVPAGTEPASYPVTLQAVTAGASTLTTSFSLNVISNPDFILSEAADFPEVNVGSSGTTGTIAIASQDGFAGVVTLSCPSTYGAGSCSISPASVSSFPSNVTLTINGSTFLAGSYSLSITASSGSVVHSLTIPFRVGDYVISGTQTLALAPGGQGTATLSLASSALYAGRINASCDINAFSGAMCSLSPPNPIVVPSGGSATLTAAINVPNNALPGTYDIHIVTQDTTGAPSHTATLKVMLAQDFVLTASTPSQSVTAGQTSGPYNMTVQPVGSSFTGAVTLACSAGLPAQAQCSFSPPTPVTPGNSAVNVVMSISTASKSAAFRPHSKRLWMLYALYLLLPGIVVGCGGTGIPYKRGKPLRFASIAVLMLLTLSLFGCGGVSNGGNGTPPPSGGQPVTYHVTVTGTSAGTTPDAGQSVQVLLVVN